MSLLLTFSSVLFDEALSKAMTIETYERAFVPSILDDFSISYFVKAKKLRIFP